MERRFAGAIIRATAEKGCPAITNRPCAERIRPVQAARSYNNRHSQNFDRFRQRDDVMLQLRYRDVSDASEEPNLSCLVRCAVPTGTVMALTLSTRQIKWKYLVAWCIILIGIAAVRVDMAEG